MHSCDFYNENCKVIFTYSDREVIVCNVTQTDPHPSPTTPPQVSTTTSTPISILATTTVPATVSTTEHYQTTPAEDHTNSPSPSPSLRGHTPSPNVTYTTVLGGSEEVNTTHPSTFTHNETSLYTTKIEDSDGKIEDYTGVIVGVSLLIIAIIVAGICMARKKEKRELKKMRSITPEEPPLVDRTMKNRNSWRQPVRRPSKPLLHPFKARRPPPAPSAPPSVEIAAQQLQETKRERGQRLLRNQILKMKTINNITSTK